MKVKCPTLIDFLLFYNCIALNCYSYRDDGIDTIVYSNAVKQKCVTLSSQMEDLFDVACG